MSKTNQVKSKIQTTKIETNIKKSKPDKYLK